jgi:sigma-E factor negative regulatory protein RseA
MSDRFKQQASALLDNHFRDSDVDAERPFDADLSALLDDQHAQAAWSRYALVGHIMRGDAQAHQQIDISVRVAEQIQQEAQPTNNKVVQPSATQGGAQARAASRWLKPAGSIAIAASVALVAVLSIQQPVLDDTQPAMETQVAPALITNPFGGRNPVSYNTVIEQPTPTEAEIAQQRQLLQTYMIDHQRQIQLSLQTNEQTTESTVETVKESPEQND